MLDLLSVVDRYRADADWIGVFYDDVRHVGTILFAAGRTLKDAKKMLRELRDQWRDELGRYQQAEIEQRACGVLKSWGTTTKTYEPGLFHAFADPRIPKTNNDHERVNKQLKSLERRISRSPRPGRRFTRNAPLNAVFVNMKVPPGEAFIARRRPEELRLAKILLQARMQSNGIAQKARRDFKGLVAALRADWDSVYNTPTAPETL